MHFCVIHVRIDREGDISTVYNCQGYYLLVVKVQRSEGIFEGASLVLGIINNLKITYKEIKVFLED